MPMSLHEIADRIDRIVQSVFDAIWNYPIQWEYLISFALGLFMLYLMAYGIARMAARTGEWLGRLGHRKD